MYDPSNAGRQLAERVAPILGLWHPLKQLMLLLWRRFAHSFFAPYLHNLIPGSRYHEKPQLVKLHSLFTFLRLAYPTVHCFAYVTNEPFVDRGRSTVCRKPYRHLRVLHRFGTLSLNTLMSWFL